MVIILQIFNSYIQNFIIKIFFFCRLKSLNNIMENFQVRHKIELKFSLATCPNDVSCMVLY